MTSSVLSFYTFFSFFPYFTHFSNLKISGTNEDISKRYMAFLIFLGILCHKSNNSTDMNLIIVPL